MNAHRFGPSDQIPGIPNTKIGDFWSWACSDVLSNANRGVFAEFLVGAALGLIGEPRIEWDTVDFRYGGCGIEVKSAAYLQRWKQELWFEDAEAMESVMNSPEMAAGFEHTKRFADLEKSHGLLVEGNPIFD